MALWKYIARQFGKPSGVIGSITGTIMSRRASNIERNEWGISLLDIKPTDSVLEIGFGPGVAIEKMSRLVDDGVIYGIDHLALMVEQASKRNKDAIASGKVKLLMASVSDLPDFDILFNRVISINSFMFWDEPLEALTDLKNIMAKGATIAIVHQPRKPKSTKIDTQSAGEKISGLIKKAGFQSITIQTNDMKPVPAIFVLGKK